MKLSLKTLKPRNPLLVPSRSAGPAAIARSGGSSRLQAKAALRREVERLRPSP